MNLLNYVAFDNNFDTDDRAWVPERWAQETLALLEENMVASRLVHTDFSEEIQDFGDTVNTRKPGEFEAENKGVNDDVTVQDATAENIAVKLDQHIHVAFLIRDREMSLSFADLVTKYMQPGAKALASKLDRKILGQVYQYLDNTVGDLGMMNATSGDAHNAKSLILDVRQLQNEKNVPTEDRVLILTPDSETWALKLDLFISAERVGDDGTALREASLGKKLGYNCFMCQNMPYYVEPGTVDADDIAEAAKGATVVVSDDAAGASYAVGQYIYFATTDDRFPYRIMEIDSNNLTLNRPLRRALSANTESYKGVMGAVALAEHTSAGGPTSYPAGYDGPVWVDGAGVPKVGQLVSFNNGATPLAAEYAVVSVKASSGSEYIIQLDRPLEAALANNYTVGYGPGGSYNFAFRRPALALVLRPLALPKGKSVDAAVISYNGLSIRVTMQYQGVKQGMLVTLDFLCGLKVLDKDQGAVLLG
ncbi:MAG: P22 phage major capsid protein family protein [Clostridia bacterium]|jgi:hypothetical protein